MADDQVQITVKVDAAGAIKAFDALGQEIAGVNVINQKAKAGFSDFQAKIVAMASAVSLAKDAINLLSSGFSVAANTLSRGSEIQDMQEAFTRLSAVAGVTADTFINQLKSATANTIPELELMKRTNEALNAGFTPTQINEVAKAARAMGETFGGSLKENMDGILDSLQRGNDKWLQSKGIIVDNTIVLAQYASAHGKLAKDLSETEKKEAMQSAALRALSEQTARVGQITDDAGDKIQQMATAWANAKNEAAKAITTNKDVAESLDGIKNALTNLDWNVIIKGFSSVVGGFTGLAKQFAKVVDDYIAIPLDNALTKFENWRDRVTQKIAENPTIRGEVSDSLLGQTGILTIQKIIKLLGEDTPEANKRAQASFNRLKEVLTDDSTANVVFAKTMTYLGQQLQKVGVRDTLAAGAATAKHTQAIKDNNAAIADRIRLQEATDKLAFESLKLGLEEQSQFLKRQVVPMSDTTGGQWLQKMLGIDKNSADKTMSMIDGALTDVLKGALDKSLKGNDWKNIVGSIGGSIGQALGAEIGLPGVGQVVGDQLGKAIFGIFGGKDTKGTSARKRIDKYFAELFDGDRLGIIVRGEMKRIGDLVFNGDLSIGDNGWNAAFEGMSDSAKRAFQGVGDAFTSLLGETDDFGSNLASVFANNIGGSLNNLQLLIRATGKSAEDLNAAIVKAFEDGNVSALQAQSALLGIQNVMQDGIPDGVGMIDQAFQNLEAAGTKGGTALIDALQDIGFEAKELGIKDLPGIAAKLKQMMPESAAAIDMLFKSLADTGITTIEGLTTATTQQLLPALSQLESMDFPFKKASESVDDLVAKVNSLEREFHTKIIVDVETNDPAGALPKIPGGSNIGSTGGQAYPQ